MAWVTAVVSTWSRSTTLSASVVRARRCHASRSARLRTRLAWAGLGSPTPGVWVTPDATKQDEVARVIADLELTAVSSSFVGPFGAIGAERDVVAQAWDLAGIEGAYADFLATFGSAAPVTPAEVMTAQIHLVHAWRRFPFLDPSLPGELLPDGWAGARAAALFGTLHARWDEPAVRHWRALQGSVS